MSGHLAPWKRKLKPLPKPSELTASSELPQPVVADAANSDGDDVLDRITEQYAAEAAASIQNVSKPDDKPASHKSMAQLREEGLATSLPAENKGFKLLQRMGWSHGQGLGAAGSGHTAPLDITLKPKKTGLGIDEDRKRRIAEAEAQQLDRAIKRAKNEEFYRTSFRDNTLIKFNVAAAEKHIQVARRTIETLDERQSIQPHNLWLPQAAPEADGDEPAPDPDPWELLPPQQRLHDVLTYLRERHYYCLFCGSQYDSEEDMTANCPGLAEEEH